MQYEEECEYLDLSIDNLAQCFYLGTIDVWTVFFPLAGGLSCALWGSGASLASAQ